MRRADGYRKVALRTQQKREASLVCWDPVLWDEGMPGTITVLVEGVGCSRGKRHLPWAVREEAGAPAPPRHPWQRAKCEHSCKANRAPSQQARALKPKEMGDVGRAIGSGGDWGNRRRYML